MPVLITKNKEDINNGGIDKLPLTKSKNGYVYVQVKRTADTAMYSMTNEKFAEDDSVGYEVFRVLVSKPCTIQQKSGVKAGMFYQYPASEKFPGNEDFGKIAWAFHTLEEAKKKFAEID